MKTSMTRRNLFSMLAAVALVTPMTASISVGQGSMTKMAKPDSMMKHGDAMQTEVGLDGYCPVCVIMKKKWEKGNPNITSTFDGKTYYFPGESIKAMFDANPEKFVPALNGDCIVCYEKMGKRVPGSIQFPALFNERLFLFPSENEKNVFKADPAAFADTDLAVSGECIVCLAKMGKHVAGSPEHTVIHEGLRYQFPSNNEADMFRQSPGQFVSNASMKDSTSMNMNMSDQGVRLVGRSGCAACEFGVTPVSAPEELGLAVVGNDGSVTVIEGAHRNYPEIYRDRFQNKQIAVEGKIVKTQGKISWLEPSSLKVIN